MTGVGLKFVVSAVVVVLTTVAGYICRRRQWLDERVAEWIMTFVGVFGYSSVAFLSVWGTPLKAGDIWLPLLASAHVLIMTGIGLGISRLLTQDRAERGLFAIAAGSGNNGFTGGAFVLYLLHGEPGMGLSNIYIVMFMPMAVLLMYPIARHHSESNTGGSLAALYKRSLLDWRSIGLPIVLAAIALSAFKVQRPAWISEWHLMDALVYLVTPLAFFAIGLRLRASKVLPMWKLIAGLGIVRFLVGAAVGVCLAWVTLQTPWPFDELRWDVFVVQSFVPTAVTMVAIANMFNLRPMEASVLFVANTIMYLVLALPVIFLWHSR